MKKRALRLAIAFLLTLALALAGHPGQLFSSAATAATTAATVGDYRSCSTSGLAGLDRELIDGQPALVSFADIPGIQLGPAVHPYLQRPAKRALERAIAQRGDSTPLIVNSAYRTIGQQLVLYQHSQSRRCGIAIAAPPGKSNHQSGLALDIQNYAEWRPILESEGWHWFGYADRWHFDYVRGGRDIRPDSIRAFQELWNQHHPDDALALDGALGPITLARLKRSPISGWNREFVAVRSLWLKPSTDQAKSISARELLTVPRGTILRPTQVEAVGGHQKLTLEVFVWGDDLKEVTD